MAGEQSVYQIVEGYSYDWQEDEMCDLQLVLLVISWNDDWP